MTIRLRGHDHVGFCVVEGELGAMVSDMGDSAEVIRVTEWSRVEPTAFPQAAPEFAHRRESELRRGMRDSPARHSGWV